MAMLGPWICDTCSEEITIEDGVVVWSGPLNGLTLVRNTAGQ